MTVIIFSLSAFAATMIGGWFGVKYRDHLHYIISFTAGVLLGIVFFEVIPEIFAMAYENNFPATPALIALVAGFLGIHMLEKFAIVHHAHEGGSTRRTSIRRWA